MSNTIDEMTEIFSSIDKLGPRVSNMIRRHAPQAQTYEDNKSKKFPFTFNYLDVQRAVPRNSERCVIACGLKRDFTVAIVGNRVIYASRDGKHFVRFYLTTSLYNQARLYDETQTFIPGTYFLGIVPPSHQIGTVKKKPITSKQTRPHKEYKLSTRTF